MESGFDPIKIAIIVLVVVVQGIAAFRGWVKKREQQKREEEARLGLPQRSGEPYSEPASTPDDDLIDWDPLGENQDEPESEPEPPRRRNDPVREPGGIVFPPIGTPEPVRTPSGVVLPPMAPPVVVDSEHSASMSERSPEPVFYASHSLQRQADPPRKNEVFRGRLPGDGTLRSAMLAKMVLERPLSSRRGYGRDPRG